VRDRVQLGGEHRAEVQLVADDDVRPPGVAQRRQPGRALARDASGVARCDCAALALEVELEQRPPLARGEQRSTTRVDRREALCLDRGEHPALRGEDDGMAGALGRTRDRHERQEVPGPTGEGEEESKAVVDGGPARRYSRGFSASAISPDSPIFSTTQ
jgi:hypothetical protein